jgi:predicted amidohydrolase
MSTFKVALLQMTSCGNDQNANQEKGDLFCRRASDMGVDIALFPEMWNVGYSLEYLNSHKLWQERAISRQDEFIIHFQKLAQELQMAIALTYLESWEGGPRDSVSIIDMRGQILMTYAKVHTCNFDLEISLTPGDDFQVCAIDTAIGPIQIGAMICYDREFPESARMLMLKGAEVILTPNACDLDSNRIGQFRARAFENMVDVAMTNYAVPQNNGHSVAFTGVAYDQDEHSLDTLIVEADEKEGIYLAEFDMDRLRMYRKREAWGNAYRKPGKYGLLTSLRVEEPFIRMDSRR